MALNIIFGKKKKERNRKKFNKKLSAFYCTVCYIISTGVGSVVRTSAKMLRILECLDVPKPTKIQCMLTQRNQTHTEHSEKDKYVAIFYFSF